MPAPGTEMVPSMQKRIEARVVHAMLHGEGEWFWERGLWSDSSVRYAAMVGCFGMACCVLVIFPGRLWRCCVLA